MEKTLGKNIGQGSIILNYLLKSKSTEWEEGKAGEKKEGREGRRKGRDGRERTLEE